MGLLGESWRKEGESVGKRRHTKEENRKMGCCFAPKKAESQGGSDEKRKKNTTMDKEKGNSDSKDVLYFY